MIPARLSVLFLFIEIYTVQSFVLTSIYPTEVSLSQTWISFKSGYADVYLTLTWTFIGKKINNKTYIIILKYLKCCNTPSTN